MIANYLPSIVAAFEAVLGLCSYSELGTPLDGALFRNKERRRRSNCSIYLSFSSRAHAVAVLLPFSFVAQRSRHSHSKCNVETCTFTQAHETSLRLDRGHRCCKLTALYHKCVAFTRVVYLAKMPRQCRGKSHISEQPNYRSLSNANKFKLCAFGAFWLKGRPIHAV